MMLPCLLIEKEDCRPFIYPERSDANKKAQGFETNKRNITGHPIHFESRRKVSPYFQCDKNKRKMGEHAYAHTRTHLKKSQHTPHTPRSSLVSSEHSSQICGRV
jgi:hypothetical protein